MWHDSSGFFVLKGLCLLRIMEWKGSMHESLGSFRFGSGPSASAGSLGQKGRDFISWREDASSLKSSGNYR